jgi:hypothetical protein
MALIPTAALGAIMASTLRATESVVPGSSAPPYSRLTTCCTQACLGLTSGVSTLVVARGSESCALMRPVPANTRIVDHGAEVGFGR